MGYQDKTLVCADCSRTFTWAAGEQEYYEEQRYQPPKRCQDCRRAKKGRHGGAAEKGGRK